MFVVLVMQGHVTLVLARLHVRAAEGAQRATFAGPGHVKQFLGALREEGGRGYYDTVMGVCVARGI